MIKALIFVSSHEKKHGNKLLHFNSDLKIDKNKALSNRHVNYRKMLWIGKCKLLIICCSISPIHTSLNIPALLLKNPLRFLIIFNITQKYSLIDNLPAIFSITLIVYKVFRLLLNHTESISNSIYSWKIKSTKIKLKMMKHFL